MVRSKLRGVPAALRARLPGGSGDGFDVPRPTVPKPGVPRPDVPRPDALDRVPDVVPDADDLPGVDEESRDKLSLGLALLSLAGVALTTVGIVARLLLDRLRSDEGEGDATPDPTSDPPAADATLDLETGTEPETETGTEPEPETGTALADEADTEGVERGALEADTAADVTGTDATGDEGTADEALAGEPDDGVDVSTGREAREFPKIAPLVGMSALVAIRLFVEKLRRDDEAGAEA